MRQLVYCVAMSLDGFIAGPNGEYDWIELDPEQAAGFFEALYSRFDVAIMGRRSFEQFRGPVCGIAKTYVVSRTLPAGSHESGVTVLGADAIERIKALKAEPGKDLWLWGGGRLFGSLLAAGLVDLVEVSVCPALLGSGIRLVDGFRGRAKLTLEAVEQPFPGSVSLR